VTAIARPVERRNPIPRWVRVLVPGVVGIVAYFLLLRFLLGWDAAGPLAAQHVANALSLGAIYALVALGYTMVYGIIDLINFAHGEVFMIGGFLSLVFLVYIAPFLLGLIGSHGALGPVTNPLVLAVLILGALVFTMPLTGSLNVVIERLFYRPLRNAPKLAPLITAVGVSFALQNIALVIAGPGNERFPQVFPLRDPAWRLSVGNLTIPFLNFFILAIALVLLIALQGFVGRTRLGRAMRATAQDREAAALMGVDANQTIALTFLIGGALAGAAGLVYGLYFGIVRHDVGFNAGLKAFTSAVLGGIGNIAGAVLGGFIIGFVEVFASALGYARWAQFIVFTVLALVLVFRPTGILGQQLGERT
jgi:branched-chain amino acid transport system permease protein